MAIAASRVRGWELLPPESEIESIPEHPAPISILIVDDQDRARELCPDVMIECGYHPRLASTTEQALQALDDEPVDILLTDLRSGRKCLRNLRKCSATKSTIR